MEGSKLGPPWRPKLPCLGLQGAGSPAAVCRPTAQLSAAALASAGAAGPQPLALAEPCLDPAALACTSMTLVGHTPRGPRRV